MMSHPESCGINSLISSCVAIGAPALQASHFIDLKSFTIDSYNGYQLVILLPMTLYYSNVGGHSWNGGSNARRK